MAQWIDNDGTTRLEGTMEGQNLLIAQAHLTSAQILDLFANPVNIVAAPGAGKVVLPITGTAVVRAGGTPYTFPDIGGNTPLFSLEVLPAFMGVSLNTAQLDSAVDALAPLWMDYAGEGFPVADAEDQPLVFHVAHGDVTDGDGTLDFFVVYAVADITP
jgi:hypothetical protein